MSLSWRNQIPIGEILSKDLHIPNYQREYAWEKDEVQDFLDDLKDFVKNGDKDYLFGQIILHNENKSKKTYVIDGQQRLVTSVIFLAVVRDIVQCLIKDSDKKSKFIYNTIINYMGDDDDGFHLTLNGRNRDFFRKNVQREWKPEQTTKLKTNKNLLVAGREIQNFIMSEIEKESSDEEKFACISEYTNKFLKQFYVSEVSTDELSQAFIVFETLNSRGKDLEAADLLKNHFFQEYSDDDERVREDWIKMIEKIDGTSGGSTTQYIRYFWNAGNPFVREKGLYRDVSRSIRGKPKATEFLDNLSDLVDCYIAMVKPGSNTYFTDGELIEILTSLNKMGISSFYSLVLALCKDKNENAIKSMLKSIDTLVFRNIIVGTEASNKYEEEFSRYAKEISNGEKTSDEICFLIKSKTINDERFESFFMEFEAKERIARYVLGEIYDKENEECKVRSDPKTVHVEHIMPKTLGNKWPHISEETHMEFLNYIGNQTVLLASDNIKISNDPFSEKKKKYAESGLIQNREYFKDIHVWDVDQIRFRQKVLFETAKKRWCI